MKIRELRQIRGRIGIGRAKVTFSRIGAYMSYINFLILILTFYTVRGYKYAAIEMFIIIAIIGLAIVGMFDYFIMLPCEQAFGNEQMAKHQNPIYEEVKLIRKEINDIKKMLENGK